MRLKATKKGASRLEDRTTLPFAEQLKAQWLSNQPTSQTGLSFPEKMMKGLGMSTEDLYLLRHKLFGKGPVPDFSKWQENLQPLEPSNEPVPDFGSPLLKRMLSGR